MAGNCVRMVPPPTPHKTNNFIHPLALTSICWVLGVHGLGRLLGIISQEFMNVNTSEKGVNDIQCGQLADKAQQRLQGDLRLGPTLNIY
jgi:hypothetical protein